MVALQIRDVPDGVRDTLAEQARRRGQSLQLFLLDLVETEARRFHNGVVLVRLSKRSDGSRAGPGETAAALADARRQRDAVQGPNG